MIVSNIVIRNSITLIRSIILSMSSILIVFIIRVQDLGLRAYMVKGSGLSFRDWAWGCGVQGLGVKAWDLRRAFEFEV